MNIVTAFKFKTLVLGAMLLTAISSVFVPELAFAAPIDFDDASAAILLNVAAATAFVTLIGLAVLGMIFVARAVKWARKAG